MVGWSSILLNGRLLTKYLSKARQNHSCPKLGVGCTVICLNERNCHSLHNFDRNKSCVLLHMKDLGKEGFDIFNIMLVERSLVTVFE